MVVDKKWFGEFFNEFPGKIAACLRRWHIHLHNSEFIATDPRGDGKLYTAGFPVGHEGGTTGWQAWIVGYGPELQRSLLESLGFTNLRRVQRSAVLLGLAVVATVTLLIGLSAPVSSSRERSSSAFNRSW